MLPLALLASLHLRLSRWPEAVHEEWQVYLTGAPREEDGGHIVTLGLGLEEEGQPPELALPAEARDQVSKEADPGSGVVTSPAEGQTGSSRLPPVRPVGS